MPFFSLEFCEGGSLAARLAGTPLPPREAAQLVETLAHAMQAAHQAGIAHRELKPLNVLLTGEGTPKITDFGLAKKLDAATGQTASGAIMGTPSYMAPEQAGGKSKDVGPLADVYALGAILYELLTGRPPFKAATAMDTLLQVLSEEPVPPSRLQPKLPRDLETICLKCLEKDARKRYASAHALADDLQHFLQGEPVIARPIGTLAGVAKWARRRPALAGLLALMMLTGVTLAGVSFIANWNTQRLIESSERAAYTQEILDQLNRLLSLLKDSEAGQRGYLLTGDERYLEPYTQAVDHLDETQRALRHLTAADANHQKLLDSLQPMIVNVLSELRTSIELREQPNGFEAALVEVRTDKQKRYMDEVRQVVYDMREEENRVLSQVKADVEGSTRVKKLTLGVGTILALLLLLLGSFLVIRPLAQSIKSR
jgi:serine/threonine-protein kinase